MEIMIIMACVILTAGVLWLMGYQRFKQKKKKIYVYNLCGEHHCECIPE